MQNLLRLRDPKPIWLFDSGSLSSSPQPVRMLDTLVTKEAREQVTASEKHRFVRWLTEAVPERGLDATAAKTNPWSRTNSYTVKPSCGDVLESSNHDVSSSLRFYRILHFRFQFHSFLSCVDRGVGSCV